MPEAEKTIRLSKVTKELNIGVNTIVDFLNTKGQKIDINPNTKISDEVYRILLKEFQADKGAKEESQSITIGKLKKADAMVLDAEETSEPVIREKESKEVLIKNINASPYEGEIKAKKQEEKVAEKAPEKKEEKPAEKIETPVAEAPKEKSPEPEVIKAKAEKGVGIKVIDKIDLDIFKPKPKGAKKNTEEKKEAEIVAPKEEAVVVIPEVIAQVPIIEAPIEITPEVPVKEEPAKDDLYRTSFQKLTGPTILGKIVLEPPAARRPVASSSTYELDKQGKRKKRKRTDKKVASPGPTPSVQPKDASGFKKDTPFNNRPKPVGGQKKPLPSKVEPTEKEIQDQIKATLARLSSSGSKSKSSKYRKQKRESAQQAEELAELDVQKIIKATEFVSANELARMMNVPVTDIISTCMSVGIFVSINQRLDAETIQVVAEEFGYKVEFVTVDVQESIEEEADSEEDLVSRSPIVTVMGHVDHGKTSLLDYVRKANVIAGEAGGITQHIGAYSVTLENGKHITFLDTPGHEAFTAMRARGAKVTDVAIIVVAADDSVMPQTKEAINHALAANVPIIFAINKMDKAGANPEKIKEQLAGMNILVEDWGGKYQSQEISAKKGINVESLLEKVLLESDLLDLKANPLRRASGTVIESALDKGRGYVTTVLVQNGTLRVGDVILAGCHSGRVKAMFNERGGRVTEAGPATPVLLLGMSGAPQAGDVFNSLEDEREAREIANKRMQLQREQGIRTQKHITLDEIGRRLAVGNFKELNIIVKGDVDGSVEALADSLLKLSVSEIQINVIHKSVGQISESDVLLASASNAIIVGFQVRPSPNARKLAEVEQIDIRLYSIIYDAIDEIKAAMEGMLAPEMEEKIMSNVEVREVYKIPKAGTIAGCMVLDGKIQRGSSARLVREGIVVYTGEISSLKRFKDDVKEVATGYECGITLHNYNDIKEGDIIEAYEMIPIKRTL